jgi:hypothetical protein
MPTVKEFHDLLLKNGSDAVYHRDDSTLECPCRTPEGYRDPAWHLQNPNEPLCNEAGFLSGTPTHIPLKAFVQPIQSTRATRLSTEYLLQMFGDIQADDHLGVFPKTWGSVTLNFKNWGRSGEDYIEFDGCRYTVVNANLLADASGGAVNHHWELGLRLITKEPL